MGHWAVTDGAGDREVAGGSWSHPSTAQTGGAQLAPALGRDHSGTKSRHTRNLDVRTSPALAGDLLCSCGSEVVPPCPHSTTASTASDNHFSGKISLPKGISEQGQGLCVPLAPQKSGFPSGDVLISIRTLAMDSHGITASTSTHPLPRG